MSTQGYVPPTYGNWRKPKTAGLGSFGAVGTGVIFAGLAGGMITLMAGGWLPALGVAAVTGIMLASIRFEDRHGVNLAQRVTARVMWNRTRQAGTHLYRSGPLGRTVWGKFQAPGLLAASRLTEHTDSFGRPFAMVAIPATRHYTVVLIADPNGTSGVDPRTIDSWVANWGGWVADLGQETDVVAAAVTIDTAPDSGTRFRQEIATRLDPHAPAFARAVMDEVIATSGAGSSSIRAWITITFDRAAGVDGARRDDAAMGRDLASRIPNFVSTLAATGAGAVRPVSAQELCEYVRVAYDPAVTSLFDDARAAGQMVALTWDQVGPGAHQVGWDQYVHDSGISRTWAMTGAPRGHVYSTVLRHLLTPLAGVARKRVTLLYQPMEGWQAADAVQRDLGHAINRAQGTKASARAKLDEAYAQRTAVEEAKGAGLVDFGMLVTITCDRGDDLHRASEAVVHAATRSKVQLRTVFGSQDSAFAAALPLGVVLPEHVMTPKALRKVAS